LWSAAPATGWGIRKNCRGTFLGYLPLLFQLCDVPGRASLLPPYRGETVLSAGRRVAGAQITGGVFLGHSNGVSAALVASSDQPEVKRRPSCSIKEGGGSKSS